MIASENMALALRLRNISEYASMLNSKFCSQIIIQNLSLSMKSYWKSFVIAGPGQAFFPPCSCWVRQHSWADTSVIRNWLIKLSQLSILSRHVLTSSATSSVTLQISGHATDGICLLALVTDSLLALFLWLHAWLLMTLVSKIILLCLVTTGRSCMTLV